MECTWAQAPMPYGNLWRTSRRLFHRFFNITALGRFDDKTHKAVNVFLHRLSESPERLLKHARLYVGLRSIITLSQAHKTHFGWAASPHL